MSDNLQMPDDMRIFSLEKQLAAVTAERDKERALNDKMVESYEKADYEIRKLKAEREQMEKQEPVCEVCPSTDGSGIIGVKWSTSMRVGKLMFGDKLYAHPPVPEGKVLVPNPARNPRVRIECWTGTHWAPYGAADFDAAMLKAAQHGG